MLIVPLPTVLLDLLMIINLVFSLLTILIVLYSRDALDFSVFPTVLLVLTVYGLALNVSSTRLILSQGVDFNGKIIRAFSNFVVGSSGASGLVIGIIIFIIIVAVQFIVITKGSTRVAEVAARFTLDALPGKQMSIEAEYNAGVITEEEAHSRKYDLEREVDFYGAMDGASKFVSGNVKVGILITVVNILGGIIIGTVVRGETIGTALENYFSLAIGDGLVTQFPALIISSATGLIVTRAISDGTFGEDITQQFSKQSRIFMITAVFMAVLALLPGFPWYLMLPLSGMSAALGWRLSRRESSKAADATKKADDRKKSEAPHSEELSPIAPLDPLSLELGYSLVPLVDKENGAELLDRIVRIRREIALDLGIVVPRIRIVDNMRLNASSYSFKIKGIEIGSSEIRPEQYLCISAYQTEVEIPGESTTDPTFGLPAKWIREEYRERAEREGFTVVDPPSIIATHLTEMIKRNSADILGRQEIRGMLDALKKDYPAVVDELQKVLGIGEVQKVLQGLLRERVSIRNLVTILETATDFAPVSKQAEFLVERCRQALRQQISQQYAVDKKIKVITLSPALEGEIIGATGESQESEAVALPPDVYRRFITELKGVVRDQQAAGAAPVVLCAAPTRPLIKKLTAHAMPQLTVLSAQEISSSVQVEGVAEVSAQEQTPPPPPSPAPTLSPEATDTEPSPLPDEPAEFIETTLASDSTAPAPDPAGIAVATAPEDDDSGTGQTPTDPIGEE